MKTEILDVHQLKKFNDVKINKETIWSDDNSNINLFGIKPGQEIVTHTHHGNHIWFVVEGTGEFQSGKQARTISGGQIVIVPTFESHGIRNDSGQNLVIASFTVKGD